MKLFGIGRKEKEPATNQVGLEISPFEFDKKLTPDANQIYLSLLKILTKQPPNFGWGIIAFQPPSARLYFQLVSTSPVDSALQKRDRQILTTAVREVIDTYQYQYNNKGVNLDETLMDLPVSPKEDDAIYHLPDVSLVIGKEDSLNIDFLVSNLKASNNITFSRICVSYPGPETTLVNT